MVLEGLLGPKIHITLVPSHPLKKLSGPLHSPSRVSSKFFHEMNVLSTHWALLLFQVFGIYQ